MEEEEESSKGERAHLVCLSRRILRQGSRAEVVVEVIKSAKESLAQVSQRRIGRQRV